MASEAQILANRGGIQGAPRDRWPRTQLCKTKPIPLGPKER
jgi:hypothetical protein